MSKKSSKKDFRQGRPRDTDEKHAHVRPMTTDASVEAPAGSFVDVPQGMVIAPGTVVDDQGILRRESGELAIWHHRCKFHGPCERYTSGPENFVKLEEVVFIAGAPWCPDCLKKQQDDAERRETLKIYRGNAEEN